MTTQESFQNDPVYTDDAVQVSNDEKEFIKSAPDFPKDERDGLQGLSISGGGIRSASFSIGFLQALVDRELLNKFDYISTVSGGGYTGSALTYFLSKEGYGTGKENFAFGRKYVGAHTPKQGNEILNFIRQHGNYLTPGKGLNEISLLGVVVRSVFVSLFVHLSMISAAMIVMQHLHIFDAFCLNGLFGGAEFAVLIWAALLIILLLGVSTLIFSYHSRRSVSNQKKRYLSLVKGQRWLGRCWAAVFVMVLLGLLPYLSGLLTLAWQKVAAAGIFTIFGSIMGIIQFLKGQKSEKSTGGFASGLRIVLGAFFLIYGLLIAGYGIALEVDTIWWAVIPILAAALLFGFMTNLNYVAFHRMYRDRLMEAFMPDAENIKKNMWGPAVEADKTLLEHMCKNKATGNAIRPYHLINANVVLADSKTAKYRGRTGCNFLLSPLYCGSDATGWRKTDKYMKGIRTRGMTLPTAMAISGAAVNPNTGVAGKGLTRNKTVSALMSLLNIRLGYWAPNPQRLKPLRFTPNFIFPGLLSGVLGIGLNEHSRFLELTDGGHFEVLGVYELIRRKLKLIILADAAADPKFTFGDLTDTVERIRVDFGVKIRFREEDTNTDMEGLLPGSIKGLVAEKYALAKRGFAIADIKYDDKSTGILVYIKSTLTANLPADLYGYKSSHPDFPDETTADQFFDETQFEAYRELGYQLTCQMLDANDKLPEDQKWIN